MISFIKRFDRAICAEPKKMVEIFILSYLLGGVVFLTGLTIFEFLQFSY